MGTENQAVTTANLADFTHLLFSVIQRPFLDERSESGNGLYLWRVNVCHFPLFHPSNLCSRFVRWKNVGKSRCLNNEKFPWWPTNFADACFSACCNEKCVLLFLVHKIGQKKSKLFGHPGLVFFWSWTLQKVHFFEGLKKAGFLRRVLHRG